MCVRACVCVGGGSELTMHGRMGPQKQPCMHLNHTEQPVFNGKIVKSSMICTILVKILKTLLLSIINTRGNCN